jgi:SAM-dependent methyltransferase
VAALQKPISVEELEEGWRAAARLYPYSPSMILWRGWEYAVYRRFSLPDQVLDVGCGDGRFFRLVFPDCRDVVGVEHDPGVAHAALESGVYRRVHAVAADALPADGERFESGFANCSLEHMDNLDGVLRCVWESLRPGAPFLCSVVTDRFVQWSPWPVLLEAAGVPALGLDVQRRHEQYHHLVNALPAVEWQARFERAGFAIEQQTAIVPELAGRLFLFIDQFVHWPHVSGEWSQPLMAYLQRFSSFPEGFVRVLSTMITIEIDRGEGIGLVAWLRKPR